MTVSIGRNDATRVATLCRRIKTQDQAVRLWNWIDHQIDCEPLWAIMQNMVPWAFEDTRDPNTIDLRGGGTQRRDIHELMQRWDLIEGWAKKYFPHLSDEARYQVCRTEMNQAVGLVTGVNQS